MTFDIDGSASGYDVRGVEVAPLDAMLSHLLLHIPQLPYEAAVDMLRTKYIEFVRRTGNLRWPLSVETQAGVTRYPIPVPEGYLLHSVQEVGFSIVGQSGSYQQTLPNPNQWQSWQGAYRGTRYSLDSSGHFILGVAPSQESQRWAVQLQAQLVPRDNCQVLPVDTQVLYGPAIAAGAAGEAMNSRQKPWYDPGNSVRLTKQFFAAVGDERARMARGKTGVAHMRTARWI